MSHAIDASIIVTCFNERERIGDLLDSLCGQATKARYEVIVVDANSPDGTADIIAERAQSDDRIQLIQQGCKRGEGRNIGVAHSRGDLLLFIDADCIANAYWLQAMLDCHGSANNGKRHNGGAVLAGRTQFMGFWAFTRLHRVELPHHGLDTTWPSCNLGYPRRLFDAITGFDEGFVTAEDIDLNYRAIDYGATIEYVHDAVVYAHARESIGGFLRQAYWNGYGRKQLTAKHGRLWSDYSFAKMLKLQGGSIWGVARMVAGAMGYMAAKLGRSP